MPNRQPRRSHEQWQCLIDQFNNRTDLTHQQFCQAEGISVGTFRKHLYASTTRPARPAKVNRSSTGPVTTQSSTGHFGPVKIRASEHLSGVSCLELPGNIRLHTQSLPSAEYLHNLVKVLGFGH